MSKTIAKEPSTILTTMLGAGEPVPTVTRADLANERAVRTPIDTTATAQAPDIDIVDDGLLGVEDIEALIRQEMGEEWMQGKHIYGALEVTPPAKLRKAGYEPIVPKGKEQIKSGDLAYYWIPQEIYQRRADHNGNASLRMMEENRRILSQFDKTDRDGNVLRVEDKMVNQGG
jgi:hypothetical protein